jgi:hypothetical protein
MTLCVGMTLLPLPPCRMAAEVRRSPAPESANIFTQAARDGGKRPSSRERYNPNRL